MDLTCSMLIAPAPFSPNTGSEEPDTTQAAAGVAQFIGKVDVSQVKEIYRDIMARSGRTVDRNLLNQMAKDNPKKLYENTVAKILEHKRLLQPQALYRQDNSISNGFNQ